MNHLWRFSVFYFSIFRKFNITNQRLAGQENYVVHYLCPQYLLKNWCKGSLVCFMIKVGSSDLNISRLISMNSYLLTFLS